MINLGKQDLTSLDLNKQQTLNTNIDKQNQDLKMKKPKKKKKEMTNSEKYEYTFIDTPIYKKCTEKYFLFSEILMAMTFVTFILQFIIAKTNILGLFYVLLLTIADFLFYIMFKNEMDMKLAKRAYALYLTQLPITLCVLINHFLIETITFSTVFLRIVMGFLSVGLIVVFIVFLTQKAFRESFDKIRDADITATIKKMKEAYCDIDEEDAILGCAVDMTELDKEGQGTVTDIPIILPAKDRFLHMLVLGPTGCGKTSQTIIPMIWRDISIKKLINGKPVGITVLEPKGDLAEKVYAMVNYKNNEIDKALSENKYTPEEYGVKRTVVYFNPILSGCPYFNPLEGEESDVIENMCTTFNMLNADSPQFFKDMTDGLVRRSVKLLKRLHGDEATLLDLNTLVWNVGDRGRKEYVMPLKRKATMPDGSPIPPDIQIENDELIDWFLNDYYAGIGGAKGAPKTYENTSGVRTQITKLVSNKYLKKVLNPPKENEDGWFEYLQFQQKCKSEGHPYKINFDESLREGYIVTMSTAQGALRDLGRFLGYFIILQLQASVFRRPGNENTRTHNMLYIDEFQVYSNPGFADMLTQGRSYRVASHLATQARDQIGMGSGRDGKSFIALVSTNARNKIIYPGVSFDDAKYYSDEFGEFENVEYAYSERDNTLFGTIFTSQTTKQEKKEMKARFSPTDIIDRPFGQITFRLIRKNSVTAPGVSKISYIPKDINDKLDEMIAEDNAIRLQGNAIKDYESSKNASDEQLNGAANLHDNTLKISDPIAQMENEKQIIQQSIQNKTKFEDAIYQEPSEAQAPISFDSDFSKYEFNNLNISPERKTQIKEASTKQREVTSVANVSNGKSSNPQTSTAQFLARKSRNADDIFGDTNQKPNKVPLTPINVVPPKRNQVEKSTPIPAHTKVKPEPLKQPVVGEAIPDDSI